jgi:ribosomal protein S18 acetylase RimI-like enzyme
MWRNAKSSLTRALELSAYATVAVESGKILGYQISTASSSGAHLARLAVLPNRQNQGIGYALIRNLVQQFTAWGAIRISVNTQADNTASLSVYERSGFKQIEGEFPVYQFDPGS